MKKVILAALTVLSLSAVAANAQSMSHGWPSGANSQHTAVNKGN